MADREHRLRLVSDISLTERAIVYWLVVETATSDSAKVSGGTLNDIRCLYGGGYQPNQDETRISPRMILGYSDTFKNRTADALAIPRNIIGQAPTQSLGHRRVHRFGTSFPETTVSSAPMRPRQSCQHRTAHSTCRSLTCQRVELLPGVRQPRDPLTAQITSFSR